MRRLRSLRVRDRRRRVDFGSTGLAVVFVLLGAIHDAVNKPEQADELNPNYRSVGDVLNASDLSVGGCEAAGTT